MNGVLRGTGTQSDPWLIEDTYDFVALHDLTAYPEGTDSNLKFVSLANDIDFKDNEQYKEGFSGSEYWNFINRPNTWFDGDNHKIRNLIVKGSFNEGGDYAQQCLLRFRRIINTDFINIVFINCIPTGRSIIDSEFRNCRAIAYFNNSYLGCLFRNTIANHSRCAFTFSGTVPSAKILPTYHGDGSYSNVYGTNFSSCNFHYNDLLITDSNTDTLFISGDVYNRTTFTNCDFTGSIRHKYVINESSCSILENVTMSNSKVAVEKKGTKLSGASLTNSCGSATTPVIIDCNLLYDNFTEGSTSGYYKLTTEHMKDLSHLQSIGFQVLGVGE